MSIPSSKALVQATPRTSWRMGRLVLDGCRGMIIGWSMIHSLHSLHSLQIWCETLCETSCLNQCLIHVWIIPICFKVQELIHEKCFEAATTWIKHDETWWNRIKMMMKVENFKHKFHLRAKRMKVMRISNIPEYPGNPKQNNNWKKSGYHFYFLILHGIYWISSSLWNSHGLPFALRWKISRSSCRRRAGG